MNNIRSSILFYLLCGCTFMTLTPTASADDWPQWRGLERDGVWRETGIIDSFSAPQIPIKWRVKVSNGYSGPTIANGLVYLTDRVAEPVQIERVLCFDEKTGAPVWTNEYECVYKSVGYPDGPRASVTISDGRAYTLGTMGHVRCLDAKTGELLWKKDPGVDYNIRMPIWGIAAAPLIDNDKVIIQLGADSNACVVALDRKTGKEIWRALEDKASYSAPIIIQQGGKRVLLCWTGERIAGLNPATGELYWDYETPANKMIINVPTPVLHGDRMFLSSFYDGSYMFKLNIDPLGIEKLWRRQGRDERRTDALHSMISNPIFDSDYIYGADSYGQFRCLDAKNGDRIWEDLTPVPVERWATIHTVRNGDKYWMFNDQGELIICTLSPKGFNEISRAKLIEPTKGQLSRGNGVTWSHPGYANKHIFIRNDNELVCASLAAE